VSVYFITCREQGVCKIGRAQNAKSRLSSLQTASPTKLALEATLPGDRELEQQLHQRFAAHRLKGEWFAITDELDALINDAATNTHTLLLEEQQQPQQRVSDEELAEKSIALDRQLLAEAMLTFGHTDWHPTEVPAVRRRYRAVSAFGGQFNNHYAIRETDSKRLLCADLKLTWDQADRLCDILEDVRQHALDLEFPNSRREKAA
jgi:hypothetical protein